MNSIIQAAFSRTRTVLMTLVLILVAGLAAYASIPKEAAPDVPIPIVYVSMTYEGISPEDAERLLVKPMEKELQTIEGIKEMTSTGAEGHASVLLEFDAGFDPDAALQDVREKVDLAKAKLPPDTEEPRVHEVNVALFPVLTVALRGPLPERTLLAIARDLQDRVEAVSGVLEADIGGDREELLEVVVDTNVMETYGISYDRILQIFSRNNMLVAAGAIEGQAGRMAVKVPGVIENPRDVMTFPIKVEGDRVVTFQDIATVRQTFKDPEGFARIEGQPAVTLEIKKRVGANIIETVGGVRAVVEQTREHWPDNLEVVYLQDESENIGTILKDLQNNVISAIILVMVVIVAALGWRPSLLVGLSIPGSFLAGMLVLNALGFTLNIVVLFSLILVVGMLVDGAIVVTELAERKLAEGMERRAAYAYGAKRMAWPVITSTITTLAVFLPLLFWPGVVGHFMKYLPATVIITLTASLAMALVFIPVLGGVIARRARNAGESLRNVIAAESGRLDEIRGFTGFYVRLLGAMLKRPELVLGGVMLLVVATYFAYGRFGHGVEFFPDIEPEFAQIHVHARGDLSVWEKDALVGEVERRVLGMPELKTVYARTVKGGGQNQSEDTVGVIQLEFIEWDQRRKAAAIMEEMRRRTSDIPGVVIEVRKQEEGPVQGKPVQLQLSARDGERLAPAVETVRAAMDRVGGFVDIEDDRPLPGVEWRLQVDREKAARYGADIATLGSAVQMVTGGIKVADYRPDHTDEEVDIRVRLPGAERGLDQLQSLRVPTERGLVPVANFASFQPAPKTGTVTRIDGQRSMTVAADVAPGLLVDDQVKKLQATLSPADFDGVMVSFKGEDEEQRQAGQFLGRAFLVAILLMVIVLVTQFNSVYQALLVLSAIVFSTAGVLLGLMVTGQPFGVVMGGVGLIALAGIVVNNNIVLIDTFNELRREGMAVTEAILRTGAQRLRPVLLTSVTTVLGLIPMVLAVNIDLIGREIQVGAPSTQWWTQLSSAIAGGLTFATVLTLVLTPCLLMLGHQLGARLRRWRRGGQVMEAEAAQQL